MPEESKRPIKTHYAGNSHKEKELDESRKDRPKLEKITTTDAVQRKKPLSKRVAETFTGEDAQSVGSYILFDVIIPATKSTISDAVSQGIERMLFGDVKRKPTSGRSAGYTSYNRMSSSSSRPIQGERPEMSRRAKANHDFDEVVLATRGEAEEVLERLGDLIDNYDIATVSDLYDLIGITGSFTDDKWGWNDLRTASVSRIRDGYLLNLPRTAPID